MSLKEKYHHGDLRGALIEALRQLIERDGPDGFRIAEACRIAGVSTAAPYKHFADRGDMVRAVALSGMVRLRDQMQQAADSFEPGDPQRLFALGRAYFTFAQTEPGMFRMMFGLTEEHKNDTELQQVGDSAERIVEQVVADQMGLPPDDPEVRLRAYSLWCVVHGHSFLKLDGKVDSHGPEMESALLALTGRAIITAPR
ncbi:MAG: WHG domain-containing protein [Pseudomonadota bacterium]